MPRITTVRSRPKFLWCAVLVVVLAGCQTGRSDPDNNGRAGTASAQATTGWVAARVDVGEHSLNLNCKGSGSPAIVFESGLGGNLGTWFQTSVAHAFPSVRTCAYDRVNTGTSDRSAARHTGQDSVRDLHTLLDIAAVPAPYLLVGHSFGGLLAAMYAGTHPTEVSGLVLIDPSLPTQAELYDLIPQQERAAAIAGDEQTPENVNFSDTLEQAKVLVPKIPDIPVLVLAATSLGDLPPSWPAADIEAARTNALHDFSTALPRGELRYVDSGHFIHTEQPKLVISEIQRILENVR
jgi:pimeloyl-ACP methyl ester carboxylesterase